MGSLFCLYKHGHKFFVEKWNDYSQILVNIVLEEFG